MTMMDENGIERNPRSREKRVEAALVSIDEGETRVHKHEEGAIILGELARWTLKPDYRRQSFNQLAMDLEGRFNLGYSNPPSSLRRIQQDYVVPALARTELPREHFRQELVNATGELNVALRKMDIAERAYRKLLEVSRDPEVSPKEFSAMLRATVSAVESQEKSQEKLGIPEPIQETVKVEHTHRKEEGVEGFLGHITKRRPEPVDVEYTVRDDDEEGDE